MNREEAVEILVSDELKRLTVDERESLLLDWWSIDDDDLELLGLPESLKNRISRHEEPINIMDSVYDPLLKIGLRDLYKGVINSYLQMRLSQCGYYEPVTGEVEKLEECPCCNCCTLKTRANYEICPVCFWEDDGTSQLDEFSHCNHLTLREARANFNRFGAVSEGMKKFVLVDGKKKYRGCKK